jgi:hypothetical protein
MQRCPHCKSRISILKVLTCGYLYQCPKCGGRSTFHPPFGLTASGVLTVVAVDTYFSGQLDPSRRLFWLVAISIPFLLWTGWLTWSRSQFLPVQGALPSTDELPSEAQ